MSQLPTYPKSRARAGRPKSARGQRWSNVAEQGLRWLRAEFDSLTVPMPAWDAGRLRATAPTEAAGRRSVVADNALTAAALGGGATGLFLLSRVALRPLPSRLDVAATRLLQRRQSRAVTRVMTVISMPGFAPLQHILTVCTSLDLWALGHRRESLFTMLTMGAGATTGVIKVAVGRPRPDPVYMRAIFQFRDNSFPSGHCSHYASFYGYLFYLAHRTMPPSLLRKAIQTLCAGLIVSVAPSRVYLGHHWSSDVIAGEIVGLTYLFVLIKAYELLLVGRPTPTTPSGASGSGRADALGSDRADASRSGQGAVSRVGQAGVDHDGSPGESGAGTAGGPVHGLDTPDAGTDGISSNV